MEKKLTGVLSDDELKTYDLKADDLAKKHGVSKVHPVVLIQPDTFERVVCYLKEPNFMTKIAVMNKMATQGPYIAAEELREASIIKEESNPLTYGDTPECDQSKLGVVNYCLNMVTLLQNQYKKK